MDHLFYLCIEFVMLEIASVHCCLVADLLALVCVIKLYFITFPCGILCQVPIPDLCHLSFLPFKIWRSSSRFPN